MADLSDTPAGMIARLDASLLRRGSILVLKRGDPSAPEASVTIRGYETELKPKQLVGSSKQGDSVIIISPSGLGAFGDPREHDWGLFLGRDRSVYFVRRKAIADTIVRFELLVRG